MWELARRHWVVRNLLTDARHGHRAFSANGDLIQMPFTGDVTLDALDRLLATLSDISSIKPDHQPDLRAAVAWIDATSGRVAWDDSVTHVRESFRALADSLMAVYPRYLPDDLDVGGFTMGDAARVLHELLARAHYAQMCLVRGSESAAATIPFFEPETLIGDLARASGVDEAPTERIVRVLTTDLEQCPDPCLTPIVPVGGALVPLSSLIAPGSPLRNLTSRLQFAPERFGAAGLALGRLGVAKSAETLARVADVLLAKNVRLVTRDGRRVGDLDLVLVDPPSRRMVVFEVTWQIGADGAAEIARAHAKASEKQAQIARYRRHLAAGTATPRWPSGWPDTTAFSTRWFVLTGDVLPVGMPYGDVAVRSHQMLAWMLRAGTTFDDLLDLLDRPPSPPEQLATLQTARTKFGRYTIEWDQPIV
jgi:hypothetical protein